MQKDIFSDNEDIIVSDKEIFKDNGVVENNAVVSKKKKTLTVIIAVILVILMAGLFVCGYFIGVNSGIASDLPMMIEAYKYMKKYYYKDITWSEFQVYATSGFAGSLDNFTGVAYFADSASTNSAGLQFHKDEYNRIFIDFVYPESNAYTATARYHKKDFTQGMIWSYMEGEQEVNATNITNAQPIYLEQGDRIFSINGKRVENATTETYNNAINTLVNDSSNILYMDVVKRDADGNDLDGYYCFAIEKSVFTTKKAYYTTSKELGVTGAGMIRLMSFEDTAAQDFANCVMEFYNDENKPHKLILDLRGNGGGDSVICEYIAYYLLKNPNNESQPIAKYIYNDGNTKDAVQWFNTTRTISTNNLVPAATQIFNSYADFEVTVLCDNNSASCSELLIGALQYYNGSQIVGGKTYGKGVAQQVFRLSNSEFRLYVTNGFYYMPVAGSSGAEWTLNIHGVGFTPNQENITNTARDRFTSDNSIKRALQILGVTSGTQI